MRPRRIVPTNASVPKSEGRARLGPGLPLLAREVAPLGSRWGLLVCRLLAVLLVLQIAVVGGAYIDDVKAASAGVLVGPLGTVGIVPYDDGVVAGATVYGVVAATAVDGVIAIPTGQPVGTAPAIDQVVAAPAEDRVAPVATKELVVAALPIDEVGGIGAVDGVGTARPNEVPGKRYAGAQRQEQRGRDQQQTNSSHLLPPLLADLHYHGIVDGKRRRTHYPYHQRRRGKHGHHPLYSTQHTLLALSFPYRVFTQAEAGLVRARESSARP